MRSALLVFAVMTAASLGASPAIARDRDAAAIEQIIKERHEAGARGDKALWREHIADDCVWLGTRLKVLSLEEVEEAQVDVGARREISDVTVRDYGRTAVATYIVTELFGNGGEVRRQRMRKIDSYAKIDGAWKLVANAESLEPPPRPVAAVDTSLYRFYTGRYVGVFGEKVTITVTTRDARLFAFISGQSEIELRPASETTFFDEDEAADWVFGAGPDGFAVALAYKSGGTLLRFERDD